MMNNKLPPSYGAIENRVPLPKNQGYLLPKNEEISEEEGPSNETMIEMPPLPSQNENQQTQVKEEEEEIPKAKPLEILLIIILFLVVFIFFCFLPVMLPIENCLVILALCMLGLKLLAHGAQKATN